jgi:hypothetical protein
MIDQWPLLGIVEAFDALEGMAIEGPLHVEIAPKDKPADDPTLALMTSVEQLGQQQRARAKGFAVPQAPAPPSAKSFKTPRIHYGRGDV